MAPWARLLAQVLISAGTVFARAFTEALHHAQNASHAGGKEAAKRATDKMMGRMSVDEAIKILNVSEPLNPRQITDVKSKLKYIYILKCNILIGNFYKFQI